MSEDNYFTILLIVFMILIVFLHFAPSMDEICGGNYNPKTLKCQ